MRKARAKKIDSPDWVAIAAEYESSEIGYRDLAERHGVSFNTLQKRAKAEDWPGRRKTYVRQLCDRIREKLRERQAQEVLNDYERLVNATERLDAQIAQATLVSNNLDSAISTLISLVKAKELLGGNPTERTDDGTKDSAPTSADEALETLREIAHVLETVASHGID
jgi:transposase-like protein